MARTPTEREQPTNGTPARLTYLYGTSTTPLEPAASEAELDENGFVLQPPGSNGRCEFIWTGDQTLELKMYENMIDDTEYHDGATSWTQVGETITLTAGDSTAQKVVRSIERDHKRITFTGKAGGALGAGGLYGGLIMLNDHVDIPSVA